MNYSESYKEIPDRLELKPGDKILIKGQSYQIKKVVGKGGFGTVYLLCEEENAEEYAIKVLNLWEMMPQEYDGLMRRFGQEYHIGKIDNPYLVKTYYMGFLLGNPFIIMDYCGNGTLLENVSKLKNESNFGSAAYQILSGLKSLHDKGVVHRDIKPENLLFDDDYNLRLTDFGISTKLDNRLTSISFLGKANEAFASIVYSPPEQLDQNQYYAGTKPTMDIYSFGITMYFALTKGYTPFGDLNEYKADPEGYLNKKKTTTGIPLKTYISTLSNHWYMVIEKCLRPKFKDRFQSVAELLDVFEDYKNEKIIDPNLINSLASTEQNKSSRTFTHFLMLPKTYKGQHEIDLDKELSKKQNKLLKIGRINDQNIQNDISLLGENYSISKRQSTLEFRNEEWVIKDGQFVISQGEGVWVNSRNGTYINKNRLQINEDRILKDGDILRIGKLQLKYRKN